MLIKPEDCIKVRNNIVKLLNNKEVKCDISCTFKNKIIKVALAYRDYLKILHGNIRIEIKYTTKLINKNNITRESIEPLVLIVVYSSESNTYSHCYVFDIYLDMMIQDHKQYIWNNLINNNKFKTIDDFTLISLE